jgi:hypothetical protein
VLAAGEDERARLARGALLARAGRLDEAAQDLERPAARSRRAGAARRCSSPRRSTAARRTPRRSRARAPSGEPAAYWSDPTVGRLLFSLLVSRALATDESEPRHASDAERARLRAAERQLEHDTFWDRALVLVGWVRVGAPDEAARVASRSRAPRRERSRPNRRWPARRSRESRWRSAMRAARSRRASRPGASGARGRTRARRPRALPHPCGRCGRGTVGVDEVLEAFPAEG